MKRKVLAVMLAAFMVLGLAACGGGTPASNSASPSAAPETSAQAPESPASEAPASASAEQPASGEKITIKVFSNNSDRTSDQGLVEQTLFDNYMKENENVEIVVEALEDDPYKVKFKAYTQGSDMPDLFSVWGQPGFINEVIDAGVLAELNEADYADYGFVDGSLDGFSMDGKLYGLPRNTDVMVFFYNKDMFAEKGWEVPDTYNDLIALSEKAKGENALGVAVDGQGAWSLDIYLTDLFAKFNGEGVMDKINSAIESGDWSDSMFTDSAKLMQDSAKQVFMNGFESTDYDTAKNLFMSGQAAMLYMGSWEMAMAVSDDVDFEIGAFTMPVVEGGNGKATDIAAWHGGGYAVSSNSKVKDEAIKLLNYMFEPDNWTKIAWENNVCMSAQDFAQYMTGNETDVQKAIVDFYDKSTSRTGTPINDMGTGNFKTNSESAIQELSISSITVEEFYKKLVP